MIPYIGGIENVITNIAPIISKNGYDVRVYVRNSLVDEKFTGNYKGIKLIPLPCFGGKYLETFTHTLFATVHGLITGVDIFYFNAITLGFFVSLSKVFGKLTIVQTHGLDWKREKWGLLAKKYIQLSAHLCRYCSHVIFTVGRADQKYFQNKFHISIPIIENGVSVPRSTEKSKVLEQYSLKKNEYILFMSRLEPEKGAHTLIQAWENIDDSIKKRYKCVIAGDSHNASQYAKKIKDTCSDSIIITGFVKGADKYKLLSDALSFVQPSTIEGMSTGLLEAMAFGVTPITTSIPENIDVADKYGIYFESQCAFDLGKNIEYVLMNPLSVTDINRKKDLINYTKDRFNWYNSANKLCKLIVHKL